jgi:hypothetical protein
LEKETEGGDEGEASVGNSEEDVTTTEDEDGLHCHAELDTHRITERDTTHGAKL